MVHPFRLVRYVLRRPSAFVFAPVLVFSSLVSPLRAQTIVVPGAQSAVEGNSNNGYPFNPGPFGVSSQRYQQVYGSSAFGSLTGPTLLTAIAFRVDGSGGAFAPVIAPNFQINFSTTLFGPDALSSTFASNVGANDTVVFAGPLTISAAPAGFPRPFNFVITLTTPFLYDPSAGNLLLDVRNFNGAFATTQFDSQSTIGDAISRVYTVDNGVLFPSGRADSDGLVTRFSFAPAAAVPEPSTYGIMASAFLLGMVVLRRRASRG